jgi:hypothetical protein
LHSSLGFFCSFFCLVSSHLALTQTPTAFQQQAQTAVSAGKPFGVVNLTATAEWIAGSLHENGTAQLQANVDGSTNVQLALGKASRTEVQTKIASSRTCTWTDGAGKSHDILGPNCFVAIPWFSPGLIAQSSAALPALLGTTDDGIVSKNGSTSHQVSYLLNLKGRDVQSTNRMVSQSTVKVFYDPRTFLPESLEYSIHPDNNGLQDIPVSVAFSNYQSVAGVMLPFHIERFINRTLQLKLDVSNASIE